MELLKSLTDDSSGKWKSYLAMRGVLPKIGALITREIEHLKHLEESTLSSDLSQGYALKMLMGEWNEGSFVQGDGGVIIGLLSFDCSVTNFLSLS